MGVGYITVKRVSAGLGLFVAFFLLLVVMASPAVAHHKPGHGGGPPVHSSSGGNPPSTSGGGFAGDHDGDADLDPGTVEKETDNVSDAGDNAHPSGKDRSVEKTWSGSANPNQGKSESDPDDNVGPQRRECGGDPSTDPRGGCTDKPNGAGGRDLGDQDGNNGCGNDDDFDDDNNGWCGKPKPTVKGGPPPRKPPPKVPPPKEQPPEKPPRIFPRPPVEKPPPVDVSKPPRGALPFTGTPAPNFLALSLLLIGTGTCLIRISQRLERRRR
ncbi:MAG: hypothetical protein M3280_08395 [Actinomycetota bacterium]|nr:hypothetical protein [Actinomycetota bacterium]